MAKENDTRLVEINGRTIVVRELKDAQLVLLARDAARLEDVTVSNRDKLSLAGGIMDMFESVIVQQQDKDFVLAETRAGRTELATFLGFLTSFQEADAPKVTVKRGRPPRKAAIAS
jgi:hypothetical protein